MDALRGRRMGGVMTNLRMRTSNGQHEGGEGGAPNRKERKKEEEKKKKKKVEAAIQ